MSKKMKYRFKPQGISDMQLLEDVRKGILRLAILLDEKLPVGRCKALCLTELEVAAMWATKSISHTKEK